MTTSALPTHPSCPVRIRRRRPYSLSAICLGLLLWGIGIKQGSSFMAGRLGIDLEKVEQPAAPNGRYVHPRRR
ncbi:MAG: hypothetical protein VKI81_01255 [Synechococcaceae cyanobacterium]|nr:hypothetical protein [Synechococcaceae cyanobacterium]